MFSREQDEAIRKAIIAAAGAIKGPAAGAFINSILERAAEFVHWLPDAIAAAEKIGEDVFEA